MSKYFDRVDIYLHRRRVRSVNKTAIIFILHEELENKHWGIGEEVCIPEKITKYGYFENVGRDIDTAILYHH